MSSSKKRFSLGMVLGISLGIASSMGVVNASEITQVYSTATPVDLTLMNNVKTAVNDNNTRITNLESGNPPCAGNNASDLMVRVGSVCVDKYESSLWADTTAGAAAAAAGDCLVDGSDCTYVAQSRVGVTPTFSVSWLQATQACANAGKRLLTPGEWFMAAAGTPPASCNINTAGVVNTGASAGCTSRHSVDDMIGNVSEFISYAQANSVSAGVDGIPYAGYSGGKYNSGAGALLTDRYFANFAINATDATVGFRCAR